MRKFELMFFCVLLAACGATPLFGGVVVGNYDQGNCYPFSCFALDGGTVYQEIYSASAFPGPITITDISFYLAGLGGTMDDANYAITFSTTTNPLSETYPVAQGTDSQVFGTYHISGEMPDVLTLSGTPFSYVPESGNLLMTVTVEAVNSTCTSPDYDYCSFFQADSSGSVISRAWTDGFGPGSDSQALVTGFNTATATPEPASFGLLGTGIAALVSLIRRKR